MRGFAPSLLALSAGVAWLAITTAFLPASSEGIRKTGTATSLGGACDTGAVIARLPDVQEASGLVSSRRNPGVLWTHNDSGQPLLYAFGTDGKLRGRVSVTGAVVEDWEDIAAGPCADGTCLYIADIGDNKEERAHVTIYRVPEPSPGSSATAAATPLRVAYPDRPQDAEGLFVGPDGALHVITKGEGSPIAIYRVPSDASAASVARLERVATLGGKADKDRRITDADATPDGQWVALRTLESVEFHRMSSLLAGKLDDGVDVDVTKLGEPQGEGVAVLEDGTVYLAGEAGDGTHGGTLARLSCKLP